MSSVASEMFKGMMGQSADLRYSATLLYVIREGAIDAQKVIE
jgi:hypothetical protein